ncbi:MAG: hypothetical protein AB1772_13425, partial [Candidatus Zixiibacteriota bacterium]
WTSADPGESALLNPWGATGAADVLRGDGGMDVIAAGYGDDHVFGGDDDDFLAGGEGNDCDHLFARSNLHSCAANFAMGGVTRTWRTAA